MGAISKAALELALRSCPSNVRLGEYLKDRHICTEPEIATALKLQKKMRNGKIVSAMADIVESRLHAIGSHIGR
jgi:hypothetical protein